MFLAFVNGFTVAIGLIMAIGAQNAFIIKKGVAKSHVFIIALLCSLIDALMITLGTFGLGKIIASNEYLLATAKYGGAIFLFFYGLKSFYNSFFLSHSMDDANINNSQSLKSTIITLLAFSFLNPHLYLDTVVLIGSVGAQVEEGLRLYFNLGAILSSFVWFFCLSYGAGFFSVLFKNPLSWKILDFIIGVIMWFIATSLVL